MPNDVILLALLNHEVSRERKCECAETPFELSGEQSLLLIDPPARYMGMTPRPTLVYDLLYCLRTPVSPRSRHL